MMRRTTAPSPRSTADNAHASLKTMSNKVTMMNGEIRAKKPTKTQPPPRRLKSCLSTQAFYIKLDRSRLRYFRGREEGRRYSWNNDLEMAEGIGVSNGDQDGFAKAFRPRVFSGIIHYELD